MLGDAMKLLADLNSVDFHCMLVCIGQFGITFAALAVLFEIIQNNEDNEFYPGEQPSLRLVLDGATLFILSNERGFQVLTPLPAELALPARNASHLTACPGLVVDFMRQPKEVEAICSVGKSTKADKSSGCIGEKGIGWVQPAT